MSRSILTHFYFYTGSITGRLTHISCDVQLCLVSDKVVLEKLTVKDIGHLKSRITGLGSVLNFIVSRVSTQN